MSNIIIYNDDSKNINNINLHIQNVTNIYIPPSMLTEWFKIKREIEKRGIVDILLKENNILANIVTKEEKKDIVKQYLINDTNKNLDSNIHLLETLSSSNNKLLNTNTLKSLTIKLNKYQNKENTIESTLVECWWLWLRRYVNLNLPYQETKDYICVDLSNDSSGTYLVNYLKLFIKQMIQLIPQSSSSNDTTFNTICQEIKKLYTDFKDKNSKNIDCYHQYKTETFPLDKVKTLNPFELTNVDSNDTTNTIKKKQKKKRLKVSLFNNEDTIDPFLLEFATLFDNNMCRSVINMINVPFLLQFSVTNQTQLKAFFTRMQYIMKEKGYLFTCLYNDSNPNNIIIEISKGSYIYGNTSCCWEFQTHPIKKLQVYDQCYLYWEGIKKSIIWIPISEIKKIALQYNFIVIDQINLFEMKDSFLNNNHYSINEWNSMRYFDCVVFQNNNTM